MTERQIRYRAGRSARQLSRRARQAMAGGVPTVPIGLRGQEAGPDDAYVRQVIDLALRVGESLLASGASAADATGAALRLTEAFGLHSVHVDVTYSSITISHHRGIERDPITVLRVVAVMQQDFTRLQRLHRLVRHAERGEWTVAEARACLDEISKAPHPYSRGVVTAANMLMGAGVAALLGGGLLLMLISALTTAGVERAVRWLGSRRVPAFFCQAAGAAIPTTVAVGINYLSNDVHSPAFDGLRPSVVVASGVVVLLAGLTTVGAAQDTLDGFYVTASGRTFEVLILSGGIVAGVLGVLAVAKRIGVQLLINPSLTLSAHPIVATLAAAVIAFAAAVAAYSGSRTVLVATVIGALAWVVYSVSSSVGMSAQVSSGFAALAVGAMATLSAWPLKVPSLALATAAIVPLLPGLSVYKGVFELVQSNSNPGFAINTLLGALLTGLAIASGVTLGSLPVRIRHQDVLSRKRVPQTEDP